MNWRSWSKRRKWITGVVVAWVVVGSIGVATSSHKKAKTANATPTTGTRTAATSTAVAQSQAASTQTTTTSRAVHPKPAPKPVAQSASCVGDNGYGGIGASVAAFRSQNPTAASPPPPSFLDGVAYYEISKTLHGCVTEYTITEATKPTQSSRELLSLVGGIGLPGFPPTVVNRNSCEVWEIKALKKAVGLPYAVGFVEVAPQGQATGIVDMSASASPSC